MGGWGGLWAGVGVVGGGKGSVMNLITISVWLTPSCPKDTMCLETGSYLLNYAACAQCGERDLEIKNRIVTEDEDELITYQRMYVTCYVKVCKSYQTKIVSLNFAFIF